MKNESLSLLACAALAATPLAWGDEGAGALATPATLAVPASTLAADQPVVPVAVDARTLDVATVDTAAPILTAVLDPREATRFPHALSGSETGSACKDDRRTGLLFFFFSLTTFQGMTKGNTPAQH